MKISSTDRTMHQVLGHGFFTVPRFQRPYSWDRTNVDDFWTDVVNAEQQEYFIGSIDTLLAPEQSKFEIAAPQQ
ncbi:MAG TPA: DUF262 domain-containing protein [Burkholderiales bacterium]